MKRSHNVFSIAICVQQLALSRAFVSAGSPSRQLAGSRDVCVPAVLQVLCPRTLSPTPSHRHCLLRIVLLCEPDQARRRVYRKQVWVGKTHFVVLGTLAVFSCGPGVQPRRPPSRSDYRHRVYLFGYEPLSSRAHLVHCSFPAF
ncbi:hypothetical protein NCLIV_067530 [Neospora caninum Liverpool]|uniref:Secreted protein n=1 Tax=Neospora caninum (strain Liverpool) TaxID=572307 RepID=F0VRI0_NEOCL|nr:hypothetical protein NCLIV_067530 [Neospora caninum Liverpool]CBZ56328.1 hypothetical protein NCLIV_067530 [Neospora caninum Liverpool]CEL71088.1 TPA: hypothetical protein BN1204_067530 [Neospora caninum Liverpool]|eukprot:XP_003886353.1 hypothetical protein NCLIV_067530 [Neospora caninum Liverpool]